MLQYHTVLLEKCNRKSFLTVSFSEITLWLKQKF